ncbi:HORMA domain-containing protein 1, partial [Geodia barretti]
SKLAGAYTESETRKATIKLLRTIVVLTQTLKPLPDDVMMTMKLYYYDDVTPGTYEPPGFQATAAEDFVFKEAPMNIRVGDVDTPFHSVKLRIKTDCQQFAVCEDEEVASQIEEIEGEQRGKDGATADSHISSQKKEKRAITQPSVPHKTAVGECKGDAALPTTESSATVPHAQTDNNEKMDTSEGQTIIRANGRRTVGRKEERE